MQRFNVDKEDMAIILISPGVEKVQTTSSAQLSAICVTQGVMHMITTALSISTKCYSPLRFALCALQTYS